jgi:tetratricopeptide (TPR) repeat protein
MIATGRCGRKGPAPGSALVRAGMSQIGGMHERSARDFRRRYSDGPLPCNIASNGDSPPAGTPALCAAQPQTAGGLPRTLDAWAERAQLFGGLGNFHRAVSTHSPEAQAYFDQGMRFLWAFNHDEATRSFAKAAQLDPQCAMCYWGVALTVGPNYNLPMMAEPRAAIAWDALQQAEKYTGQTTPIEQALIGALAKRYPNAQPLEPSTEGPILVAYARAMKAVAERVPDDIDVQVMTAEALMNTNAWKLWSLEGAPAPGTEEILAILEKALVKDPQHPGANHYYIHAVGISNICRLTSCSGSAAMRMPRKPTATASQQTSPITSGQSRSTIMSCTRRTITNSSHFRQQWRVAGRKLSKRPASPALSFPMTCWQRCQGSIGMWESSIRL